MDEVSDALALLSIAASVESKETLLSDDIVDLENLLRIQTVKAKAKSARNEFTISNESAGYLQRSLGSYHIHFPFNLAKYAPSDEFLEEMIELSQNIGIDPHGSICVSGSATFLGGLTYAADLDYCEYITKDDHFVFNRIGEITTLDSLVRCRLSDRFRASESWKGLTEKIESLRFGGGLNARIKLDFVLESKQLGTLPATNVVLPFRTDEERDTYTKSSFVYQEAVISQSMVPIRTLIKPADLNLYIHFLIEQAQHYAHPAPAASEEHAGSVEKLKISANPIKALKRILSLCSLLALDEFCAAVLEILNDENCGRLTMKARVDELFDLALDAKLSGRQRINLAAHSQTTKHSLDKITDDVYHAAQAAALSLVDAILGAVTLMLNRASAAHPRMAS